MSRRIVDDFYIGLGVLSAALGISTYFAFRECWRDWFSLDARSLTVGLVGGALQASLTHLGYHMLSPSLPWFREEVVDLYALMNSGMGPKQGLPIVLAAIWVEELVWRGVALPTVSGLKDKWLAGLLSVALYTVAQIGSGSWLLAATAFFCGWVWWAARVWGRSLTAPTLMHLIWSLIILVFVPLEGG